MCLSCSGHGQHRRHADDRPETARVQGCQGNRLNTTEKTTLDASTVYLLPGLHGRLERGLGAELLARGLSVTGRETVGGFDDLPFAEQVRTVADDLLANFWHPQARVIANSFGAYLFLNAQALIEPFPGRVLMLSALIGEGQNPATGQAFTLPRSEQFEQILTSNLFSAPRSLEVHVGALDWQANPARWQELAARLDFKLFVVPKGKHRLDHGYVASVLNRWLPQPP